MKCRIERDTALSVEIFDGHRCQFGISEALGLGTLLGGGDLLGGLGGLFGVGDAAAATGVGTLGAATGVADAAATTGGATLADLVGTGTGLFGGTLGTEGSLLASGAIGGLDAAIGTGVTGGALGTALDFLAAPGASGFNAAALTPGIGTTSGATGAVSPSISSALTPSGVGGTSVFDTGTAAVPGVSSGGAPAATTAVTPPGASAASLAAPSGVTAPVDATATGTAATGAAATGAPAASTSSISQLLNPSTIGNSLVKSLTSNPLGIALGAGGLGYSIYNGQKQTANEKALSADAATATANSNQLTQSGEALQSYLTSGTLPPAYQQQVDQAIQSAKTAAISNAAQQGQPTDPTKNTALAQSLAAIDNQRPGMVTQVASQLFSSGTSLITSGQNASGLSGSLYQSLVSNDTAQAKSIGSAIASLAAAMNGKSSNTIGGLTISQA